MKCQSIIAEMEQILRYWTNPGLAIVEDFNDMKKRYDTFLGEKKDWQSSLLLTWKRD